jgi:hypothetical protein
MRVGPPQWRGFFDNSQIRLQAIDRAYAISLGTTKLSKKNLLRNAIAGIVRCCACAVDCSIICGLPDPPWEAADRDLPPAPQARAVRMLSTLAVLCTQQRWPRVRGHPNTRYPEVGGGGGEFCTAPAIALIPLTARSIFAVSPNPPNAAMSPVSTCPVVVASSPVTVPT